MKYRKFISPNRFIFESVIGFDRKVQANCEYVQNKSAFKSALKMKDKSFWKCEIVETNLAKLMPFVYFHLNNNLTLKRFDARCS